MKSQLFLLLIFFLFPTNAENLFEDITFINGKALKNNIPVIFHAVGKTGDEINIFAKFGERIKSHSSLHFYHNKKEYYIPISNQTVPDFLFYLEKGDTLYIDLVIFDYLDSSALDKSIKNYYSYVNNISKK